MASDKSTASGRMAVTNVLWFTLLLSLLQFPASGQTTRKYLVLLRDKASSPYSTAQPDRFLSPRSILRRQKQNITVQERDLPVNPAYVTQIRQTGATVWYTSRWLNAVLVEASSTTINTVLQLPFVRGLESGRALSSARVGAAPAGASERTTDVGQLSKFGEITPLNYGNARTQITQLGVDQMHQQGYRGEGILIGILDSGFRNANQVGFLQPLFTEKRVLATYDFVKRETSVYEDDDHGLSCLSTIAATVDNQLYGTAFKTSFILLRTEDVASESRLEEANWLFAAEYADSAGVDVLSSSLGYYEFDDVSSNYTYSDLDGKTALSTRAAQVAAETGMVVVVSAGNEGSSPWRYISPPADAASVLAIGAVDQTGVRAAFSSFGPSADGRVKPDLVARGQGTVLGRSNGQIGTGNGTSFSAPLVAGLAAGFWQAHPSLTAAQVTHLLRRSGSQYGQPDQELGYGIPHFERASVLADTFDQLLVFPNPFSDTEPLSVQWGAVATNGPLHATLIDRTGRVLWRHQYVPNGLAAFVLPNLNLSAGLYFMTLVSGDQRQTIKVLKR